YVNNANPLEQISVPALAEMFREGSRTKTWKQAGVKVSGADKDQKILRVRAAPGSTAADHLATVLGRKAREDREALEAASLTDALALVTSTPTAIAYGACRPTTEAKLLRVSPRPGAPAVAPNRERITD